MTKPVTSAAQKRTNDQSPEAVQQGNQAWWTHNPMAYDWHGDNTTPRFSSAWFDEIDRRFIHASRLFATDERPFDRIIPFAQLAGKRVLEIGCGMGLHTKLIAGAGADLTSIDLSPTSIEATRRRLELAGLKADVRQMDAEKLEFPAQSFDFVWSWGVIHHSSRTTRIVREIARVCRPGAECRVMVYNRDGLVVTLTYLKDHLLNGAFLHRTFEETLYRATDGYSARYFVREQFEDVFRGFFGDVSACVLGQDVDVVPLPRGLRQLVVPLMPEGYLREAQARRGAFLFVTARNPEPPYTPAHS
jgi:2-polyprenyl-3-methyl-5-hydroxy-6-metoxy-1,4-benzoquinol methylase